jgi:hypothetical protein
MKSTVAGNILRIFAFIIEAFAKSKVSKKLKTFQCKNFNYKNI